MANKEIKIGIIILVLIFLSACEKSIRLDPLTVLPKSKNETHRLESLLTPKEQFNHTDNLTHSQIETPSFSRVWKRGPLSPPVPPAPPQDEEKKKEEEEKPLINPVELIGVKGPVSLNVENMPLSDFIIYVLGELLRVPFLIDEDVRNLKKPVTLRMPKDLPPEDVFVVVVDYLVKQELRVEQRGRVLSITKPKPKPKPAPPPPPPPQVEAVIIQDDIPETSGVIMYFHPLKHVRPSDIDFLIRDVFRAGLEIRHYGKENALYFIGPGTAVKRVVELIRLLDIPTFVQKKLSIIKLNYWDSEALANQLSDLLGRLGYSVAKNIREPGILIIPIKTFNGILFAFPDEETRQYVVEWIKKFDTPESAGTEERFFVYRPRFSKARDLAEALQNLLTVSASPKALAPPPTTSPGQPPSAPQPPKATGISGKGFNISVDEKRNLLLIATTPPQYQQILQVLQELDRPPRQVLIEATILELTLKDELKMGLEWYIRNLWDGNYTLGQGLGVPSAPGLTFRLITDTGKFNLLINFFAGKGLTNILSTPRILVLDNQEAVIQVGTDVPVITGEVAPAQAIGTNMGVVRSIQYRNTGIILRVKPTILAEDLLQLDITQEVSEMGASPAGLNSPTILVRRINSSVVAGNGESIVLGGLISNTKGKEESKVPLLGDLPLLGNLFKSQAYEERKTELLVLLRPYIIKGLEEATALTKELKDRLEWLK